MAPPPTPTTVPIAPRRSLSGGTNTYAYVFNNPLRWIDATGLVLEDWEPDGAIGSDPLKWGGPFGPVCGSGPSATLIPDGFLFVDWTKACTKHDDCYSKCGASRLQCDLDLLRDTDSPAYFIAVRMGGQGPFDEAQKKCNCSQSE